MGSRPSSKAWSGRAVLAIAVGAGIAGGFALGLLYPLEGESGQLTVRVDTRLRIDEGGSGIRAMEQGWDRPRNWGTWMSGSRSSILLEFDGPAAGDVDLLVEARTGPATEGAGATVVVRYNEAELGRWRSAAGRNDVHRRFIVPQEVFNRSTFGRLAFETVAGPTRSPVVWVAGCVRA